ncbi:oligosaccharide flippase family protein [bacterium]|nr:oligosaccharide flippase family protein [bacterium]
MQEYVQEKKTVALGAGFGMFGYFLSTVMGLMTNVILYRRFDISSEVDVWVLAFSFFAVLEPFARLGLSDGVQRFIGIHWADKDWGRIKGVIMGAFQLSFAASILMIACVWLLAPKIAYFYCADTPAAAETLCKVLRCLSFYLIPIALTTISLAVLRALNDIRHSVWIETLCQKLGWFLVVLATSFMPQTENRIMILVWGMVVVNITAFLISVSKYKVNAPRLRDHSPVYERKALFFFSIPLVLQSAILIFMKKCDIMMLGYFFQGENYSAQYNAAGIATLVIANILLAFSSLFAPLIAKVSEKKDYRRMNELYKTVTRWMLYITMPAAAIMLLFPGQILAVFKLPATPLLISSLRVLVCAQIVSTLAGHSGTMLIMSGYSRMILYINVLAVFANILFNLLLIPSHAMFGAALATLVAITIRNSLAVVCTMFFVKSQPFSLATITISLTAFISGALAFLLFGFVMTVLPDTALFKHWIFQLLLSGFLYALFYIPLSALTMHKDDRGFLIEEVVPRVRRALGR